MMEILLSIENSGFGTWVRESPSLLAYTLFLSLHAVGLAFLAGPNTAIALRLLGYAPGIPLAPMEKLFPIMYAAFWINAVSGAALLTATATDDLINPMFYLKLGFIALAVVNLLLLRRHVFRTPAPAPAKGKILAVSSLALWSGAIIAGRLSEYPDLVRHSFGF